MISLALAINFVERTAGGAVDKTSREQFRKALDVLGRPDTTIPVFHVAGTNGKGAVSMMLTNGIKAAGHSVGTYMSPFVYDVRERWLINGEPVDEADFINATTKVMDVIHDIEQGTPSVSTFEIKTLVAFVLFEMLKLDYVVLEVGIGGLLDATNVIPAPVAAIITSIGFDHVDLLGPTIEDIARQKAGIIKVGTGIVVCGDRNPSVMAVVSTCASDVGASVKFPDPIASGMLALPGPHQRMNAAVALTALEHRFGNLPQRVFDSVLTTTLPGRFESTVVDGRTVVFDGAHNQAAAKGLACAIRERCFAGLATLVVAHSGNHDSNGFGSELTDVVDNVVVTTTPFRPQKPDATAAFYRSKGKTVTVIADASMAIRHAIAITGRDQTVIVCGSFYLASSYQSLRTTG
ncbi:MAG: bifunctional folylpolyglutamate synthase/dihydrofolate synthase [Armatimonadota bacterium]